MKNNDVSRTMGDAEMAGAGQLAEERLAYAQASPVDSKLQVQVHRYLRRNYRMEVRGTPEEGYLATAPELPGCVSAGETPDEALRMLRDAMATWIEAAVVAYDPVPEPAEERYSGRLLLRMPKSMHARLAEQARRDNVSINQCTVQLLAEGLARGRNSLSDELERALGISVLPPGPERDLRTFLVQIVRVLIMGDQWGPSVDAPGSPWTSAANAYFKFLAGLPPEVIDELRTKLETFSGIRNRPNQPVSQ